MFVLKNRYIPQPSEAICHNKSQPFETVAEKNIHPMMFAAILFTGEKIFTVVTPKTAQNHRA